MSNSEEVVIAWTTIPAEMDASELARELVKARLAACVSVVQKVHSIYRWEGKIEANEEQALMIKTTRMCVRSLERRILTLHNYELPEFVVTTASDGYGPYLDWVRHEASEPHGLSDSDD
tara:strand:- start:201 stop:557 length:357 start_codon:yes stop_codon:yes gene_type:complete